MPEWLKTSGAMVLFMIIWDLIRIPIQSWVTKKFLQSELDEIDKALDEVQEDIQEEADDTNNT